MKCDGAAQRKDQQDHMMFLISAVSRAESAPRSVPASCDCCWSVKVNKRTTCRNIFLWNNVTVPTWLLFSDCSISGWMYLLCYEDIWGTGRTEMILIVICSSRFDCWNVVLTDQTAAQETTDTESQSSCCWSRGEFISHSWSRIIFICSQNKTLYLQEARAESLMCVWFQHHNDFIHWTGSNSLTLALQALQPATTRTSITI